MIKLLKKISIVFILLLTFTLNLKCAFAASASVSLSASSSKIYVNDTITVTVTVSESGGKLGSWNFDVGHDSSKLSLISGSEGQYGEVGDGTITSKSYTLKYKAIALGTSTISVKNADIRDWDSEQSLSVNKSSISISVVDRPTPSAPVTKSSDNNLNSLSVDGATLTPEFNKDTLEYSVELESDVTKINVSAEKSDSKASITGTGEREVSTGQNKIEIVVTAENGSTKTYIINANVKEKDPINVKVSDEEYTVVRNLEGLTIPDNFNEVDVTIDEETIKGCYNEITGFTLVALKNSQGDVKFFIYDLEEETYSKFNSIVTPSINIIVTDLDKNISLPYGYTEVIFKYNGEVVKGYALDEKSDFRLIYGIDTSNGEKSFYQYDLTNNTIQKFYDDQIKKYSDVLSKSKLVIIILGIFILFLTIIIIILLSKNVKFKNKYLRSRLNPIDNPISKKDVKYEDLQGTQSMEAIDAESNKKKKNKEKTFLDE